MCGIAGFVGDARPEALAQMMSALSHRGPDGRGSWSQGPIHLGHTRLTVIDLAGGAQPMASENGSMVIVFNGEIYDHRRLRADLVAAGQSFQTDSDTEVILAAYRVWGTGCLARLHGMFAFVLYDRARERLFGARDRFGKKPFAYFEAEGSKGDLRFAFASEVSALRQHPVVREKTSLDPLSVARYLLSDAVPSPDSIWSGIKQLPAAHAFTLDLTSPGQAKIFRYWDRSSPSLPTGEPSPALLSPEQQENRLVELLRTAVERRLVADVPVGVFLSGGVDSSAVLALAAQQREAKSIATFSIGFDDPSFDESPWAEQVAHTIGATHHHRLFTAKEMLGQLDRVVQQLDEPLADPSLLPTALLSSFAREHVTVALSGEGGDELLAGYDPFRALPAARWYRRCFLRPATPWLQSAARAVLPRSERNMSLDFKVERFLSGLEVSEEIQLPTWLGSCSLAMTRQLIPSLAPRLVEDDVFAEVKQAYRAALPNDIDRALDFFQRYYLTDDILRKVDRASMFVGLEVRCPFLDTEFADFANQLPANRKWWRGQSKYLFKRALERQGLLPSSVIHRAKKGFGIPVARWLRSDLRPLVQEHLVDRWPAELSFVDTVAVRSLVREHLAGRANRAKELWALLILALWVRRHSL